MKSIFSIFLLFILIPIAYAGKKPLSINEAVLFLEKKWSDKQKEAFRTQTEEKAVSEMDLSYGIWIRSRWIYNNQDTALVNEFIRMGIDEPNDMSSIILTCLHRKLNNQPQDIEGQAAYYKAYWKPIRICEAAADKIAEENFKRYTIGDSITIYMDVDAKFGTRNAVLHKCPDTEWSFDYKNDLMIKGIVLDKYSNAAKKNVSLKVKIILLSSENTTVLFKKVKPGDEHEFHLRYLLVK